MAKYAALRRRLEASAAPELRLEEAAPASRADLLRVHAASYVDGVLGGTLPARDQRRIGLPWSPALAVRSLRVAGASMAAARAALAEGVAVSLAGGTHHADRDGGAGFCVFNDVVVAARALLAEGAVRRVLVIDCDVHQGDGTARLAAEGADIYSVSVHAERNFPHAKASSRLDIGLADDCGAEDYLAAIERALAHALPRAAADLAFYNAGADPYAGDALGRLSLDKLDLRRRDERVLDALGTAGIPVAVVMGGGYAEQVDDIVDIHDTTVAAALAAWQRFRVPSTHPAGAGASPAADAR